MRVMNEAEDAYDVPDESGGAGEQASGGNEMGERDEGRCDVFALRCERER